MRNHEVTRKMKLLDGRGMLNEPGWSRSQVWEYSRADIRSSRLKIKEWDYYLVMGRGFGAAFTISDDGYAGLQSVSFLDFNVPCEHTGTVLELFPMGKHRMPADTRSGNCSFTGKGLSLEFIKEEGLRRIKCDYKGFNGDRDLSCDIILAEPDMDTMVIATPWTGTRSFYYNQKINCMSASGKVIYAGREYDFNPESDFGTLDWGRGVWTYDNTWNWGSGNGIIEGKAFGFNIGYGFGDTKAATENILFYDGRASKLDDITLNIPEDSYMKPWTFASSDGRFEMEFIPVIDRAAKIDLKFLCSDQHQVFGRMSGKAILDGGRVLDIKDLMCFAERVHNRY